MYSEPPQGKLRLSQAGGWTEAALPRCQQVGQPEEAALFPGMEMRDSHYTGMTDCGKSSSKKAAGGSSAAGFAREMGTNASLWWEAQKGKAGQILEGQAEL